jgi:hypothetical protein
LDVIAHSGMMIDGGGHQAHEQQRLLQFAAAEDVGRQSTGTAASIAPTPSACATNVSISSRNHRFSRTAATRSRSEGSLCAWV